MNVIEMLDLCGIEIEDNIPFYSVEPLRQILVQLKQDINEADEFFGIVSDEINKSPKKQLPLRAIAKKLGLKQVAARKIIEQMCEKDLLKSNRDRYTGSIYWSLK